jgi:hypothetical protein
MDDRPAAAPSSSNSRKVQGAAMWLAKRYRSNRSRIFVLIAFASSAVLFPAAAAHAEEYCSSRIYIYSRTGIPGSMPSGSVNYINGPPDPNNALCYDVGHMLGHMLSVGPGRRYDTRIITPGANIIMVRMFVHSSPKTLTLSGLIKRRGIRMSMTVPPVPGTLNAVYDSPWIPLDPASRGSLTATVGPDSNTYHTVGGAPPPKLSGRAG